MPKPRPKRSLVYFAGFGRSGSTLVGKVIGSLPGVFNVGELSFVWDRAYSNNELCGCGTRFRQCDVWARILHSEFTTAELTARNFRYADQNVPKNREILSSLLRHQSLPTIDPGYEEILNRLYDAIFRTTEARLIVDSSKFPAYLLALLNLNNVRLHVVQLVRDPRASANSWARKFERADSAHSGTEMERYNIYNSTRKWWGWNTTFSLLRTRLNAQGIPSMAMAYEDFARNPQGAVERILRFLDHDIANVDIKNTFPSRSEVIVKPDHSIWGNPGRLSYGSTTIREDLRWKTELPFFSRVAVTAMTAPYLATRRLRRYGSYLSS